MLICFQYYKSSHRRYSVRKGVLRNFAKLTGNSYARFSFLIKLQAWPANLIRKQTLAKLFSSEFCEIFKNTFFIEHLWTTASDIKISDKVKYTRRISLSYCHIILY